MNEALLDRILSTQQFWVAAACLGVAVWAAVYTWRRDRWKGRILEPGQVQELIAAGEDPLIWDTRKPAHKKRDPHTVKGALALPLEQVPAKLREMAAHRRFQELRTAEVIVFDTAMDRATLAAKLMQGNGMYNVALMRGGLKAWRAAGLPTTPLPEETDR
ncbi:MAG: rhodanese-like domain-containing protein [Rhodospirillaceae bacterium]